MSCGSSSGCSSASGFSSFSRPSFGFRTRSCWCWAGSRSRSFRVCPSSSFGPRYPARLPAAAALLVGLLHLGARPAREPPARLAARDRARRRDDGRRRRRRALARRRPDVAGRVRARRDRLAHRPDRRHLDRASPRRPASVDHRDREREPPERRERARLLPDRGRRDGRRHVLALGGRRASSSSTRSAGSRSGWGSATSCVRCASASTTRRRRSLSRSSPRISRTCRRRRSGSRRCSPRSRSASTWAGTRPSSRTPRPVCTARPSGRS